MQQVSRAALAREWTASQLLLYVLDAAKSFDVECDDKILTQISVQLSRLKLSGGIFVGLDSVNDEVKVVGKRLDLRSVAGLDTILDGQVMKIETVQQQVLDRRDVVFIFAANIYPDDIGLIG